MNYGFFHSIWTVLMMLLFIGIVVWAWSAKRKSGFEEAARMPLDDEMDSHLLPLIPIPSPSKGEGGEPNALRATPLTRGEKKHG